MVCEDNLYVILDMHAAPGWSNRDNKDDSGAIRFFLKVKTHNQQQHSWKKLAERYANEKIVYRI
jgi:aryl-phospho-beta-D-glucosidase BglC (GH1 family)